MRVTLWKVAVVVVGTVLAASAVAVTRHGPTAAAEETRPFADAFDRANGAVGNGWTALRGTWAIQNGAVVAGGVTERLLVRAQPLGATFTVSASLTLPAAPGADRSWTGIATNIVRTGDTQSYYALRVGQRNTDGNTALWQLVRIDRSAPADESSLLASGTVTAQPGDRVVAGLTSEQSSTALGVRVEVPSRSSVATRSVALRQIDRLAGGFGGLYSQNGSVRLDEFSSLTVTRPADVSFADSFGRAGTEVGNGWAAARGTWILTAGGVAATGTDTERVLHPAGVTLGSTFTIGATLALPSPAPVNRAWAGVAFNVQNAGNYYALRVGLKADDAGVAQWQVVRLTNSVASLLKGGTVRAPAGTRLRLTVTSRNLGTGVQVGVTGGAAPVDDYVAYVAGAALSGGRGGLYSGQGTATLDDFALASDTGVAAPPSSLPPLDCSPTAPDDYDGLPGGNRTVDPVVSTVGTTWAGHPVDQSILTNGNDQYVAYYDAERRMTVAKRTLPATTWTYQRLGTVLGWDSHNYVTMALDSAGHLHVAGNMHVDPLRYFRTTVPGDIATLQPATPMVEPARETQVTYPRFLRAADGTLIFSYRQGSSGQGVTYYNRYDAATRSWTPLLSTPFTDGEGLRSAYEDGPRLGPDGYWHVTLMWRDTTDAGSSSMPSYMRSRDLVHWEDSAGAPIALPVRYSTADVIDPVPIFGGAVNGLIKTGFDAAGRLVVVYSKYDENLVNQFYAARPDGAGGWRITKLTAWTGHWNIGGGGTLAFLLQLSGVSALPDGNLRVDYACRGSRRTLVVDPQTSAPIADVPTPSLPAQITAVRSGFPGMGVKVASSQADAGTYVLRWESLGPNNDQPRDPADTPAPQPLEVYLVR